MICGRVENATFLSHLDKWSRNLWIEHFRNLIQSLFFEFFTSRFQHFLIYRSLTLIIVRRFESSLRLFRNASLENKHQLCFLSISIHKITSLMHILFRSEMNKNLTDFCFFFFRFSWFLLLRNDSQFLNMSFASAS